MAELILVNAAFYLGLAWWAPLGVTFLWCKWRRAKLPYWFIVFLQISCAGAFASAYLPPLINWATALAPPLWGLWLGWLIDRAVVQTNILASMFLGALLFGGIAVVILRYLQINSRQSYRHISLAIVLITAWLGGLAGANVSAERTIQAAAKTRGATCLKARSFSASIQISGSAHAAGTHAYAVIDGRLHQWSYRQNAFYPQNQGDPAQVGLSCPTP